MELTFWELAKVVGAQNDWKKWQDFSISTVEFDSRLLKEGSLFVPLGGERDGHDFWNDKLTINSKAALWSRAQPPKISAPYLQVPDTLAAMQLLASYYLKKIAPKVVAITGSNGKTTTKDLTASVLSQHYRTYKTQGNYNNHIGLPYTILHMPVDTEALVLEMGMDHKGEIAFLSKLAQPDAAAVTMIGESHIEHLGSRQNIAAAKMEIVEGLSKTGLLVLPGSEPLLKPYIVDSSHFIQTFGNQESTIYAFEVQESKFSTSFKTNLFPDRSFAIPIMGEHNVSNALIAILLGKHYGLTSTEIQQGLEKVQLTQNRTQWVQNSAGTEILSDVYNANPTAMKLVLTSFSQVACKGQRIAVLGDMLDLGTMAETMHQQLAEYLNPDQIHEIYLYGTIMKALYQKLKSKYANDRLHYYPIAEQHALSEDLQQKLQPTDLVMVKGSNGMHMDKIVASLLSAAE